MKVKRVKSINHGADGYMIEKEWIPNEVGEIAIEMAKRWGMVAATADGEDSAGRQQLRLLTPYELADRAINTAVKLVEKMRQEGLVVDTPIDKNQGTDQD